MSLQFKKSLSKGDVFAGPCCSWRWPIDRSSVPKPIMLVGTQSVERCAGDVIDHQLTIGTSDVRIGATAGESVSNLNICKCTHVDPPFSWYRGTPFVMNHPARWAVEHPKYDRLSFSWDVRRPFLDVFGLVGTRSNFCLLYTQNIPKHLGENCWLDRSPYGFAMVCL